MTHNVSNTVSVVWNFREQKGVDIKGSSNKFTNRIALKNPHTLDIIDRIALVSKKPLDRMPKNNIKNKILNLFGYGWVVIRVKDPYTTKTQYLQVNARSLSKRIFEGKWFITKNLDITDETIEKVSKLEPNKPVPRSLLKIISMKSSLYIDPLLIFTSKPYDAIKNKELDEVAYQGLAKYVAIEKFKTFSEKSDAFIVYRDIWDNKLHLLLRKNCQVEEINLKKDATELILIKDIHPVEGLTLITF